MVDIDLEAIRERAARITGTPWTTDEVANEFLIVSADPDNVTNDGPPNVFDGDEFVAYEANADFAAHAAEDVPALLAALDAVTAERDRLAGEVKELQNKLQAEVNYWLSGAGKCDGK